MNSSRLCAWIILQYCVTTEGWSRPATRRARALLPFCAMIGPCFEAKIEAMAVERAIGLPDLNDVGATLQRLNARAEIVGAAGVQREFVEIGILDRVIGVRPTDLIAVSNSDEGRARKNDAAGVQFRMFRIADDKIGLHQLVDAKTRDGLIVAPGQMRIAHQNRVARRAFARRDRPAV